jgi:hypothetical protein
MKPYWTEGEVLSAGQCALLERSPSKELLAYLAEYQGDLLTTGTAEGLPSFAAQRDKLINALRIKYAAVQGYHQTISALNVDLPKFWELVLSMDFVSHEIKLANNIGYDDREIAPGVRRAWAVPYAEFTIFGGSLKRAVAPKADPAPPTPPTNIVSARSESEPATREASVFMRGRLVCIAITGDNAYPIARLEENGTHHKFMNYLTAADNSDIDITINDISSIKGLQSTRDLTELARHCGFSKQLKEAFFKTSKHGKVRFRPTAYLNDKQVEAVKIQAAKLEARNRMQIGSKS